MATILCRNVCFTDVAAVVFDKDGTLANSHPFLQELAKIRAEMLKDWLPDLVPQLLATFGSGEGQYDPAGLMAVGTRYENEIAAAAYVAATGTPWVEALAVVRAAFQASDRHFSQKAKLTPPFAQIPPLLQQLHAQGIRLAVLSGDTTAHVQDFVTFYGFDRLVDCLDGSDQAPMKPDPLMLWNTCQTLGVSPEQTVVVGDSALDLELARRAGAKACVSVTWGGSLGFKDADVVISAPTDLQVLPD